MNRRADRNGAITDSKLASVERRLGDGDVVVGKPANQIITTQLLGNPSVGLLLGLEMRVI